VPLAVPLTRLQLDAAQRLHAQMDQWQAADKALKLTADRFPRFDYTASLVKVVCLNSLYGTNLYAIHRMAAHIVEVMPKNDLATAGVELVEQIASLPKAVNDQQQRHHWSFASKFCHFFADAERFPIMDAFALQALEWHLGRPNIVRENTRPYLAFTQNINALKRLAGLPVTVRQLDHYLWIAGAVRARQRNPDMPLNADLDRMMKRAASTAADLLTLAGVLLKCPPDGEACCEGNVKHCTRNGPFWPDVPRRSFPETQTKPTFPEMP
jgi:hypothetical protein